MLKSPIRIAEVALGVNVGAPAVVAQAWRPRRASAWMRRIASTCARAISGCEYSRCVFRSRRGPDGVITTASITPRVMLLVARAGQGRMWRITCTTGSRVSIMLPKRLGLAGGVARFNRDALDRVEARHAGERRARTGRRTRPLRSGQLSATSCRQSTSKSAMSFACATMRAGSKMPSAPRPHWMFQVMIFIGRDSGLIGCRCA